MDDLSGETAASQAGDLVGTSENRPDKQSGEELSACLGGTYWSRLPVEMQIEIVKQKSLNDDDRLNLLCAYPDLLSVISESYPHDNPNAANGGEGTEAEPPKIYIKYSSEKKMFYDQMARTYGSRQPHRIFGLEHNRVVFRDLDSESKHTAILLDALKSTSTTTRKLYCSGTNKADFLLSFAFAKLNKLTVFGFVHADDDSLLSHLSKFPPSLGFNNTSFPHFLHDGHVVKFLRTLVSTKFEEGSPAANALKRIVNWTFQMNYETETEEEATTNRCKLLSELVADIIAPNSEIVNLDAAMGAIERRIFELRLAVGDEQHVIYVKEEVEHLHGYRAIQLANQTEDFSKILDSKDSSIPSDLVERMSSSDSDPDSDIVDPDEDDEFVDDDH
ncbi:hypothetical protein WR25_18628 [Diploscapter pachys]|uniref:Uncharacterized protein n=1 Tax=Diploscapter pachys TaxID=2018661 RepID=A0A2A2LMY4_9BILA|nr:hypothetical protein WR25_18628 [Diploscapter pachys]